MFVDDWVEVTCPGGIWCAQTALIACCVGGHIPVISYLVSQRGADLTLAGNACTY